MEANVFVIKSGQLTAAVLLENESGGQQVIAVFNEIFSDNL